jgi:poly(A) polymerase/tRNA nucleotidyltransferase (CCA-adding enzyme)
MEIALPPRLRKALEQAEHLFGEAHLVGGAVRDLVLGYEPKDLDFATALPPEEVARRIENARLPVGLSGAAWGTVFTAFWVEGEKVDVEITTYRREIAYNGRHPVVEWTDSVIEDLARRDFTVNAMALDSSGKLLDPFDGFQDMREGVVRAVGDPRARFEEDPLRVVRALRFAARYGWEIEEETLRAMASTAHLVRERVTLPRLGQEVGKGLVSANPGDFLRGLHELDLLYHLLPELAEGPHGPAHTLLQNPAYHPEGDVLSHLIQVVERAKALGSDELGAWAALLHDVGKPATATPDPQGWYRFPGHDVVGAEMVEGIAARLGWSGAWREAIETAVRLHMRPLQSPTPRAVRRFQAEAGEHLPLLEMVCRADGEGRREDLEAWFQVTSPVEPLLRGRDLLALGVPPGPGMGELLKRGYEFQLELGLSSKEEIIRALGINGGIEKGMNEPSEEEEGKKEIEVGA